MAKSAIINPVEEQERKDALLQPHNLFVVDELLHIDIDAFNTTLSLGIRNPAGQLAPALTVKMPLPFFYELGKRITAEVEAHKDKIKKEHQEFYDSI